MARLPDVTLTGKNAIVTGSNTGIGKAIARDLAQLGATVTIACRSRERGETAAAQIIDETGNDSLSVMVVDLSSQHSIRDFAARVRTRYDALHILVNNAGIWPTRRALTEDGIETTWATNVLGYFLLTNLLVDLLRASAPARIVNVASGFAGQLDLDDVQFEKRRFEGWRAYRQSKQANRMLTWTLAERLEGTGVTANAIHPGGVSTELFRDWRGPIGLLQSVYDRLAARTPTQGGDTATYVASAPGLGNVTGGYWYNRRQRRRKFYDVTAMKRLWTLCERMTSEPTEAL
jgi:NAD(P)-dependent dehydrogenase (short-subunit alcohol dehydrogenase family)